VRTEPHLGAVKERPTQLLSPARPRIWGGAFSKFIPAADAQQGGVLASHRMIGDIVVFLTLAGTDLPAVAFDRRLHDG
jgi:hypothetical protein